MPGNKFNKHLNSEIKSSTLWNAEKSKPKKEREIKTQQKLFRKVTVT